MTLLADYQQIVGTTRPPYASQEELDQLGQLLDELERVEAYMYSSQCTRDEYHDCELERRSLSDQIDVLMEYV